MRPSRQGVIIWYRHRRNIKQIKRYGHLIYASNKLKYAVLYVDQEDIQNTLSRLEKLSFVKQVSLSHKPSIRTDFENVGQEKDEEYNYNMGI